MTVIIGARVNKKLYTKILQDCRSASEIVRTALNLYYTNYAPESNVNTSFTAVNNKEKTDGRHS